MHATRTYTQLERALMDIFLNVVVNRSYKNVLAFTVLVKLSKLQLIENDDYKI